MAITLGPTIVSAQHSSSRLGSLPTPTHLNTLRSFLNFQANTILGEGERHTLALIVIIPLGSNLQSAVGTQFLTSPLPVTPHTHFYLQSKGMILTWKLDNVAPI